MQPRPDDDRYKHQKQYMERRKQQGWAKVSVWIPTRFREDLLDYAAELREANGTVNG